MCIQLLYHMIHMYISQRSASVATTPATATCVWLGQSASRDSNKVRISEPDLVAKDPMDLRIIFCSEFRDVMFEDVVFDNNRCYLILYLDFA